MLQFRFCVATWRGNKSSQRFAARGNVRQGMLLLHERGHSNTEISEVTGVTRPGEGFGKF